MAEPVEFDKLLDFWRGVIQPGSLEEFGLAEKDVRINHAGLWRLIAEIDRLRAGGNITDPRSAAIAFITSERCRGLSWEGVHASFVKVFNEMRESP